MAISHEVFSLFVEPYFRANIAGVISAEQIKFIQSLKMVNNMENLISENLYIFEEPELKSIKDAIQEILDVYAREVLCIEQRLYVTQSWSLTNNLGVGMHGHSHSNSILSGSIYYCELPEPPASMVFTRHVSYQRHAIAFNTFVKGKLGNYRDVSELTL